MTFGEPIYRHEIVGSTQDVARDLARQGNPPGTVVTSEQMTAGRGRQGRKWYVPPGANVCLTAIAPPLPLEQTWQVGIVAGLAVVMALQDSLNRAGASLPPVLRFPNDVLLNRRKVCGVLVETVRIGEANAEVVPLVGIGINVRRTDPALAEEMPLEVAARAISLEEATDLPFTVAEIEACLLHHLTVEWGNWQRQGFGEILRRWDSLRDSESCRSFILDGQETLCRVEALTANGWLTLRSVSGEHHSLHAAEVLLDDR
ncbi:MAG: biotin--[acetyl-CoA-carboxylase] ligase [Armatimonadaceae bacterium]